MITDLFSAVRVYLYIRTMTCEWSDVWRRYLTR